MSGKIRPACQAELWRTIELPKAWPDDAGGQVFKIIKQLITKKVQRLKLPENLFGAENIPKYALQEFHSLPNGNYSNGVTKGYIRSFDKLMLNTTLKERIKVAARYANAECAVDLGCGGGQMAHALSAAGIKEVWGIEISPYLIKQAAIKFPELHLRQEAAENLSLPDAYADVVTACFLFHEVPPRYSDKVLQQAQRVLKPGGHLCIIEPSHVQLHDSPLALFKQYGFQGLYFRHMAKRVYEPFLHAWHKQDKKRWLEQQGFRLLEDNIGMPLRTLYAEKI